MEKKIWMFLLFFSVKTLHLRGRLEILDFKKLKREGGADKN